MLYGMSNLEVKAEEDGMFMLFEDGKPAGQKRATELEAKRDLEAREKNIKEQERGPIKTHAQEEEEEAEQKRAKSREEERQRQAETLKHRGGPVPAETRKKS